MCQIIIVYRMLENFIAPYDATPFKRLDGAGAVLMGKTNLDEFSMGSGAVDSIFGPTKNVWRADEEHIAGGSSGGSAVAVATGSCFAYASPFICYIHNNKFT